MNKPLTINRAYAMLDVKFVDQERRTIKGIATTPTPDRLGDVIEPLGISFNNPMPLLWQHMHDKPVGNAVFGKATKNGIPFEAQLPLNPQSAAIRERVEEAWESVKLGLVRGVSIGFVPKDIEFMKESGGLLIKEAEVVELSLVTIPANKDANILDIKSADTSQLVQLASEHKHTAIHITDEDKAATGQTIEIKTIPASRGNAAQPQKQERKAMPRTIAEQISAYEAKRAANAARMVDIMKGSDESGSTLDQAGQEEFDTLETENKSIDDHLRRLRKLDEINKTQLVEVAAKDEQRKTALPEVFKAAPIIKMKANVPPGTAFTRLAMAMAAGKGSRFDSIAIARKNITMGGWDNTPEVLAILEQDVGVADLMAKAVQAPGTTTDSVWAAPLVAYTVMASEFIELLRPATIIGRIPNLRRVPFNIQMPATTSGTSVNWVGEAAPKPVSQMAFATVTLRWAKAAGIVVLTDELVRFSNPSAESVVRADLVAAMAQFLDRQFVDPAVAEVTNTSPASITNGVTPVVPTGTNEAAFRADAKTLLSNFLSQNLTTAGGVWIMTQQQALALSLMINALGQQSFAQMTPTGGTLLGYPVVASENIPSSTGSPVEGFPIIFCIAPEIMLADDGQTVIDASNQASIQMESAPDSPPTASTLFQSLWQANMTALRAERWINWKKRRSTAVGYIQSAKYA